VYLPTTKYHLNNIKPSRILFILYKKALKEIYSKMWNFAFGFFMESKAKDLKVGNYSSLIGIEH